MLHSDDTIKKIFAAYRVRLDELERQKTMIDTDLGKNLLSLSDTAFIQCEATEDPEGIIVTIYRIDPNMTASPDLEPKAVISLFFPREYYYTPKEIAELEEQDDEDAGYEPVGHQDDGTYIPPEQPAGPNIGAIQPSTMTEEGTGQI
jgi:hypothetical protein